jgi:CHAT domain-containing protein/Flp pilus assembly protein TadD
MLAMLTGVVALLLGLGKLRPPDACTTFAAPANEEQHNSQLLNLNTPVKREIQGGELHAYSFAVNVHDYVRILIVSQGVEPEVTVSSAAGHIYSKRNSRRREPAPISLVVTETGPLAINVRSPESKEITGTYELKVTEIRPANDSDERRVTAEDLFARAEDLRQKSDAEANRNSLALYEQAMTLWRGLGDQEEVAHTLKHIGDVHQSFYEMKPALSFYQQALALFRKVKDLRGEAETLNESTAVKTSLGDQQNAIRDHLRAMKIAKDQNDRVAEAQALNNMGEVKYWSGDLTQALNFYRRALAVWIEVKDRKGQAQSYTYVGYTCSDLGQTKEAFDAYRSALALWKSVNDERGKAVTLTAIGRLYSRVGESQAALNLFERAMPLSRRIGNKVEEARVLTGEAYVYWRLGEDEKALDLYHQAIQLFVAANYAGGEASTLHSAGRVYYSSKNFEKALEYERRALEICRQLGDRHLEIVILIEIGRLNADAGDHAAAIRNFVLARDYALAQKDQRWQMEAWNLLGKSYEARDHKQALQCYERALALSRAAEFKYGESAMLYQIARSHRDYGDVVAARKQIESAIDVIESLRTKVTSQDLRASYFASVRQLYELYIDLLMELNHNQPQQNFDVQAFEASERGRARSLLEMLTAARVGVRDKVEPKLLEREQDLRTALSEKEQQLEAASGTRQELAGEVDELIDRYQEARAVVHDASLDHTDQARPTPLNLQQIREQVLSNDAALLVFSLGDKRSFLWLITKNSFTSSELPGRDEIETRAKELRELLMAPVMVQGESFEDRQKRLAGTEEQYWTKATSFSNMLLGPVAQNLGSTRLLIVPDGELQYLPFNALPIPFRNDRTPLLAEHEITFQPSASALFKLKNRSIQKPDKGLAIFADPVFGSDDQRFAAIHKDAASTYLPQDTQMTQALRDVNSNWTSGNIPRLAASHDEAEGIVAVIPGADNLKAVGFEASKQLAMAPHLSQYRLVHFATHGVLDNKNPELSGLVLSRIDEDGRPKDAFLRLDDIYNLKLNSDLVVLSACNSGLGKDVRGEGLVGLVHGFMYAGTSRVVASLWKVDDDATAELMVHFYKEMFSSKQSPAAALRTAQLAMWQQKRWHAPYYWAAFVLQGDYEGTIHLREKSAIRWWQVALGVGLVIALAVGFLLWKRSPYHEPRSRFQRNKEKRTGAEF